MTKKVKREEKNRRKWVSWIVTQKLAAPLLFMCAKYVDMKNTDRCGHLVPHHCGQDGRIICIQFVTQQKEMWVAWRDRIKKRRKLISWIVSQKLAGPLHFLCTRYVHMKNMDGCGHLVPHHHGEDGRILRIQRVTLRNETGRCIQKGLLDTHTST